MRHGHHPVSSSKTYLHATQMSVLQFQLKPYHIKWLKCMSQSEYSAFFAWTQPCAYEELSCEYLCNYVCTFSSIKDTSSQVEHYITQFWEWGEGCELALNVLTLRCCGFINNTATHKNCSKHENVVILCVFNKGLNLLKSRKKYQQAPEHFK